MTESLHEQLDETTTPLISMSAEEATTTTLDNENNTNNDSRGNNHQRHERRRLRRRSLRSSSTSSSSSSILISALLALTLTTTTLLLQCNPILFCTAQAQEVECPPEANGWAASADCSSYFWCTAGARSSITYDCVQNMKYDVKQAACVNEASPGFVCEGGGETTTATASTTAVTAGTAVAATTVGNGGGNGDGGVGAGVLGLEGSFYGGTLVEVPNPSDTDNTPIHANNNTNAAATQPAEWDGESPTAYPTKLGPPIYYGDFRTASCQSSLEFSQTPDWISAHDMFQSKFECCQVMFGWAPIENCMGLDFVEANYVIGTRDPTTSPSTEPTMSPSMVPSASGAPSAVPTNAASGTPSGVPSAGPSEGATGVPSWSPSEGPSGSAGPTLKSGGYSASGMKGMSDEVVVSSEVVAAAELSSSTSGVDSTSGSSTRPGSTTVNSGGSNSGSSNANANDNFLVQLLGWANSDLTVLTSTPPPVPSPSQPNNSMSSYSSPTYNTGSSNNNNNNDYNSGFSISEITLPVIEDATISKQRTHLNFGTNSALAISGGNNNGGGGGGGADTISEGFDSLLKFDIQLIDPSRPISQAILQIHALDNCDMGGTFTTTSNSNGWEHNSVNWDNAPQMDGYVIGSLGKIIGGNWYELDVTSALDWNEAQQREGMSIDGGNDFLSIRVTSNRDSRCMYSSMESGGGTAPFLSVKYSQRDQYPAMTSSSSMGSMGSMLSPQSSGSGNASADPGMSSGQFILLRATDDSTIDAKDTNANAAYDTSLKNAFDINSFLVLDFVIRFDLTEMRSTPPRTAVLTMFAEESCTSAGTFVTTEGDGDWSEETISWSSAPMYKQGQGVEGGTNIGTFGGLEGNKWYGFDVVVAVSEAVQAGKSAVTFRVSSGNSGVCQFSSIQSGRDPKLMVAF